jgi:hypothetical protein
VLRRVALSGIEAVEYRGGGGRRCRNWSHAVTISDNCISIQLIYLTNAGQ